MAAPDPLAGLSDSQFPGLSLDAVTARPAWPQLRFELAPGIPDSEPLKRIEQSTKTAVMIFERVFRPEDEGFLSFVSWWPDDDLVFFPLLPPGCSPDRFEGRDFYREGEDDEYVRYSATLRPRSVDYRSMFRLIACCDFAQPQSLGGRAYFAKMSEPMIFHMYDDRGAVVLASKPEHIDDLRAEFEDRIIP